MRLTETQYADLLERRGVRGSRSTADVSDPPFKMPADVLGSPSVRGMNKTEAAYHAHLQTLHALGVVTWHRFEPMKLRLATGAYYKPDFGVRLESGEFQLHETKGHWREAARVRIKVAAELFPFFRFIAIKRVNGGWQREEFS